MTENNNIGGTRPEPAGLPSGPAGDSTAGAGVSIPTLRRARRLVTAAEVYLDGADAALEVDSGDDAVLAINHAARALEEALRSLHMSVAR